MIKSLATLLTLFVILLGCSTEQGFKPKAVIVSVAPHQYLVERIAGHDIDAILIVPPGASPHSFEPKPQEILKAKDASLYFAVRETFENRLIKGLKSQNPNLQVIDLCSNLPLIEIETPCSCHGHDHEDHHHHHEELIDNHIWLSPKLLIAQAQTIQKALTHAFPEFKTIFELNTNALIEELQDLQISLDQQLASLEERKFITSHPAFAYFCQDFNLQQIPLEVAGKELGPKDLLTLLNDVKQKHVQAIVIEPQYRNQAAQYLANNIDGAQMITINPYAKEVEETLQTLADFLVQVDQNTSPGMR